jgi:histone deacetylase 1/2
VSQASCVEYVKSFNLPTLVLGGGGYTVRNVARCWAHETSVLLGAHIANDIPYNDFYEYYAPDYKLHLTAAATENLNKPEQLEALTARILQNLKFLQGAPSVQMHAVPPDWVISAAGPQEVEDSRPDERTPALTSDGGERRQHEAEAFESDKDNDDVAAAGDGDGGQECNKKRRLMTSDLKEGDEDDSDGDDIQPAAARAEDAASAVTTGTAADHIHTAVETDAAAAESELDMNVD